MFLKYAVGVGTALAISFVGVSGPALAKVEGDTITLGSALSFTGKYATNGIHTQRGYDFAVDRINSNYLSAKNLSSLFMNGTFQFNLINT